MTESNSFFTLEASSPHSKARVGTVRTAHGNIQTPVFMPVGTVGSVKSMTARDLEEIQAQIILGNTYHLYLRPGADLIDKAGGLHRFIGWKKPMLTDSGGFQVWSLQQIRTISEEGVEFRSHIDGKKIFFTPENVMETQRKIGADIIMAFDECPPYPSTPQMLKDSLARTLRWTDRAVKWLKENPERHEYKQHFFGIVQGGLVNEIRKDSIDALVDMDLPGYAIGGLSVGEPMPEAYEMTDFCTEHLPAHKPRYVMGVGTPTDLLNMIRRGVDMFDCVIPTRNARNGMVWTWQGALHYKAARYADKLDEPLDPQCGCYTCQNHSKAYIRHLFKANELTALHLATVHNLYFFQDLMRTARAKILEGTFESWSQDLLTLWAQKVK
jgi:queuine tRNA-ribosyltransferase